MALPLESKCPAEGESKALIRRTLNNNQLVIAEMTAPITSRTRAPVTCLAATAPPANTREIPIMILGKTARDR